MSSAGGLKRAYRHVGVVNVQGGFQVLIDGLPLRTPGKKVFELPTEALAQAIAAEWEWQKGKRPLSLSMPLTGLAATAIDQPKPRDMVVDHLLKYLHTDVTIVRSEPGPLQDRQAKAHNPLLDFARVKMGWDLFPTESIYGSTQQSEAVAAARAWLQGLDAWHLASAGQLTATCKSIVIAAALLSGDITPAQGLAAASVEEDFQLEEWGPVEAAHDLDLADNRTRVWSAVLLPKLLRL